MTCRVVCHCAARSPGTLLASDGYVSNAMLSVYRPGAPGMVLQVDPIKPTWKAPETDLLTLKYVESLSTFAFKFDLCRYTPASCRTPTTAVPPTRGKAVQVDPVEPTLKAPGSKRLRL